MADGNERAKFSLADGRIEIEGSEGFVAAQLAKLESLLHKMFEHAPVTSRGATGKQLPSDPPPPGPGASLSAAAGGAFEAYKHVFEKAADGRVSILQKPPGSGFLGQSQSIALLLTYANSLLGHKQTSTEDIRAACKHHGCLDSGNFSRVYQNTDGKKYFTVSSGMLSLTFPGTTKAKELADSLNK